MGHATGARPKRSWRGHKVGYVGRRRLDGIARRKEVGTPHLHQKLHGDQGDREEANLEEYITECCKTL